MNSDHIHSVYHIWFKTVRFARRNYGLSTNCVLVLNAAYIYNKINYKPFTRFQLIKFATYYSHSKIGKYITVLTVKGFLEVADKWRCYDRYIISPEGIKVINEIDASYQEQLSLFIDKYSIE